MKDKDFLKWLYSRLVNVHGENEMVDYMSKFRSIIVAYDNNKETPNTGPSLDETSVEIKEPFLQEVPHDLSEQEIIDDCVKHLRPEDIEYLRSQKTETDVIHKVHHTYGRHIRNRYHLWQRKWDPEIVNGVDVSSNHPDAISSRIITGVWKYANTI